MNDSAEWRPVPGFPKYEASRGGAIRNASTLRELTPKVIGLYAQITLQGARGQHPRRVHRIIAETFLGAPPTPRHVVRHLDGDGTHNAVSNLAWGTYADNEADKKALGRARNHNSYKTACLRGHEFTEENTYATSAGRSCRQCRRERLKACSICGREVRSGNLARHMQTHEKGAGW